MIEATLREHLKTWQFWSLEVCVVVGLVLAVLVARQVARELDRRDVSRMTALALLAVALTVFVAPRTNRIYYDEQIYQSIGQNLSDVRLAQMCNNGIVEYGRLQCLAGEYNKQPYAYPHLLSLVYRLGGVDANKAFVVNAIVMGLTVCAVYLATFLLFSDRVAAFLGALIIALTPEQLLWSATAAVEPSASLAVVTALAAAAYFCRSRNTTALLATSVATAYAVQFRPESFLVVPVIGALMWLLARDEFVRPRFWLAALLFVALIAVHLGHIFVVRNEGWGTTEARVSLRYLRQNLRVNGRFYICGRTVSGRVQRARAHRPHRSSVPGGAYHRTPLPCRVRRHRPGVLRGQLQLRCRRALLAHDVSAHRHSRGDGWRTGGRVARGRACACLPAAIAFRCEHRRRGARLPVSLVRAARSRDD